MSVFLADEQSEDIDLAELRTLTEMVLAEEGYPHETEVTILLINEEEMSGYNERFLDRSGPTDVLAFPVEDLLPGVVPEHNPQGPPLLIGDVIVAPSYIRRQAVDYEVTFEDEMALMVTHGVLHLIGYDHIVDGDAERMEQRERDLLAKVGRERR
jgi:probable rRNA maturation factor